MLNKRPLHNRFVVTRVVFPPPKLLETSSQHALLPQNQEKLYDTQNHFLSAIIQLPLLLLTVVLSSILQVTCRNRAVGRSFACSLCSKSFPTKRHLHEHNKRKHPQEVNSPQSTSSQPSPSATTQPPQPSIVPPPPSYQTYDSNSYYYNDQ